MSAASSQQPQGSSGSTGRTDSTIRAAVITAIATVIAAVIAAITAWLVGQQATQDASDKAKVLARAETFSAFSTAVTDLTQRISGGTIGPEGQILNQIGRTFTVSHEDAGRVKIVFDQPFSTVPVAMATVHKSSAPETFGVGASIVFTDQRSVVVLTSNEATGSPTPSQFSFMVLESTTSKP